MSPLQGLGRFYLIVYGIRYIAQLMQEKDEQSAGAKLERDLDAVGNSVWEWVSGCIIACLAFYILLGILWLLVEIVAWILGK